MRALLRHDTACRAIAKAKAIDEVKGIRDQADALRLYARQARNPRKVPDRPPDTTRRPVSRDAEHGATQKNSRSASRKHIEKRPPKSQQLAVYDGAIRVANIAVTGDEFTVVLPDGTRVGSFKTLKQASAAIPTAQGGVR